MKKRVTIPLLRVVEAFIELEPPHYGYSIASRTGLRPATVQPILNRLEEMGWLESTWENDEAASKEGRPRRKLFTLTGYGYVKSTELLRAFGTRL